jgi:RNA polymerase sigma-70 factor (ECF subfamily)
MGVGDITGLIIKSRDGDPIATEHLMEMLYPELRRIAGRLMKRERPGHVLQTTALIHEAYIRMMDGSSLDFENRSQLLGLASRVMRNLLVDHARSNMAQRRGGPEQRRVPLEVIQMLIGNSPEDVMAVHDALEALAMEDLRSAKALEGYFYGGLTIEELAAWLHVSARTVKRDLEFAKAWMYQRLVPFDG